MFTRKRNSWSDSAATTEVSHRQATKQRKACTDQSLHVLEYEVIRWFCPRWQNHIIHSFCEILQSTEIELCIRHTHTQRHHMATSFKKAFEMPRTKQHFRQSFGLRVQNDVFFFTFSLSTADYSLPVPWCIARCSFPSEYTEKGHSTLFVWCYWNILGKRKHSWNANDSLQFTKYLPTLKHSNTHKKKTNARSTWPSRKKTHRLSWQEIQEDRKTRE